MGAESAHAVLEAQLMQYISVVQIDTGGNL